MKICMDGLGISQLHGTGLYSYSYELLSNLLKMYPQPKYELIWDQDTNFELWRKYKNLEFIKLGINRKDNDYRLLEEHLASSGTNIYHSPNNGLSIPQNKVCRYIISVHDLSPLNCPKFVDDKYYKKFNTLFPNALEKADCIIAVSNFIKEELIRLCKVPDKKIEVIHPLCSEIFKVMDIDTSRSVLKARYNIEGKFILYAGSIHTRKNLDIIINAFKLLLKQVNDINLIIVGNFDTKRTEYYLSLKALIQKLDIEDHIIFTGTVPYIEMPYFYNCAECTVNLSSYEGYPITAVEAISCNSKVVCCRTASFEEVLGQSAVFLDNLDVNILKNALLDVINKKPNSGTASSILFRHNIKINQERSINKLVRIYESTVYGYS